MNTFCVRGDRCWFCARIRPMRHRLTPTLHVVIFSLLGLLVLTLAAVAAFLAVGQKTLDLATVLPADSTVAFFRHMTANDERIFAAWFPLLTKGSIVKEATVALLTDAQKNIEWIAYEPGAGQKNMRIDGVGVLASGPAVPGILGKQTMLLSQSVPYLSFTACTDPRPFAAFVRLPREPESPSPWMDVVAALRPSPSFACITRADASATLQLYGDTPAAAAPSSIPSVSLSLPSPAPSLALRAGAPGDLLRQYMASLPRDRALLTRALWEKEIGSLFEQGLSMDYDILPLLQHDTSIYANTGTAPLPQLMLTGRMDDADALAAIINRLHAQMRAGLGKSIVLNRTIENYPASIVKADESHIEEQAGTLGNWQLRVTAERTGSGGLWTGQRGGDYVISTRKDWLESLLESPQQILLPQVPGGAVAQGMIGRADAAALFSPTPSLTDLPLRVLLDGGTRGIVWSIGQQENVTSVNMQPR